MRIGVAKAYKSQTICGSTKQVSVNSKLAAKLDLVEGMQLRLKNTETGLQAPFTIEEVREDDSKLLRIPLAGREKLGSTDPFTAEVSPTVPYLDYTDAWRENGVAEITWNDQQQNDIAFLAPHAGDMEANTDVAAAIAAKRVGLDRAVCWMVHYFGEDAFDTWHITSSKLHPKSYPGLGELDSNFEYAVSFHLWSKKNTNDDDESLDILVGGLADQRLRDELGDELYDAVNGKRAVETRDGKYMAETERNVVNWLTHDNRSGIQIEMPPVIAKNYRKRVARRVADFLS